MTRPLAVVTGASQGVGRAIALALAGSGHDLLITGRNRERLDALRTALPAQADATQVLADLTDAGDVDRLAAAAGERPSLLVHAAGLYVRGPWEQQADGLRAALTVNVEAPARLTRLLLPALRRNRGQIVFVNSTQGRQPGRDVGAYAASKMALRALADSLRQEVNEAGIRVLTVFPGSMAGATQERLAAELGRPYRPDLLLQPDDVAAMVLAAVTLPRTAEVTDILMRPMRRL